LKAGAAELPISTICEPDRRGQLISAIKTYKSDKSYLSAEFHFRGPRATKFIDQAKAHEPKFHYQRNTIYLRFCHADYHKGAALAELSRLTEIPREVIFAAGDHHNDISMLDGRYAAFPACPANAIDAVKSAVRGSGGRVAEKEFGAGVHEALQHFLK